MSPARRGGLLPLALGSVVLGVAGIAAVAGGDGGPPEPPRATATSAAPAPPARPRVPLRLTAGRYAARLTRPVRLRSSPGGQAVARLATRTEYRSPRVLSVVGRRGGWLGVLSEARPNGRAGWIAAEAATLVREPYRLEVDRSARRLVVLRDGRVERRIRVAVGAPGTRTPTGRFAVTDVLRMREPAGPYGCCALALTGRQPDVPQDWTGGDRLAIHGTAASGSIGAAVSAGCVRAPDAELRWLMRRLPLGTPVRVVA